MTVASALLYLPNPVNTPIRVQDFQQGPWEGTASTTYNTVGDMEIFGQHKTLKYSLRSFIEALQISQGSMMRGMFNESVVLPKAVFELVRQETSGQNPKPVYLGVSGPDGAHALLAYEAEAVSETEARIYVYDCNYPKDGMRYVTLKKSDPAGYYDSFLYEGGKTYNTSIHADSFLSDAYPSWLGNIGSKPPLDALRNLICVGAKKAKIVDANGNVVATVNGDGTTTTADGVEELRMVADTADQASGSAVPETYAFFVPRGQYTIVNMDEKAKWLEVSASNIDRSAAVETTANTLTVIVDDAQDLCYVRIEDADADYTIALGNSYTDGSGDHFAEYLLTGSTDTKPVAFAYKGEGTSGETLTENVDLTQTGVEFKTRVDADIYHDVDLDAIAAECQNAEDYRTAFEQKAAAAVEAAKAAEDANPPMESGWSEVTEEAEQPRPITGSDLGGYKPMDSVHGGTATGDKPVDPGHSGGSGDSSSGSSGSGSSSGNGGGGSSSSGKPPVTTEPDTEQNAEAPFNDVAKDTYYFDAVLWAAKEGIIRGTSEATFTPDRSCTRAEMTAMLYRAAKEPAVAGESTFQDLAADAYYRDAAVWAHQSGIVRGTAENTFSPDAPCTRAQIVTMLYRAAGEPTVTGELPFQDADIGTYYYKALLWAYQKSIINGTGANTFSPDDPCTRAMAAVMLYRMKNALGA